MVQQPPGPPGGMQPPPPPPGMPGGPPRTSVVGRGPQFAMSKLPLADIIVAGCALILAILNGIGWYRSKLDFANSVAKGEGVFSLGGGVMSVLAMVGGILLLLFALAMMVNRYLSFIPGEIPAGLIYVVGAALVVLFLLLGIVVKPRVNLGGELVEIMYGIGAALSESFGETVEEIPKASVSWAMWVFTLLFALGIGTGGILKVNEAKRGTI